MRARSHHSELGAEAWPSVAGPTLPRRPGLDSQGWFSLVVLS